MSENNTKAKKNAKKKKSPIRYAKCWASDVPGSAAKMLPMLILIIVMGLLMTAVQAIDIYLLRAGIGALLTFAGAFLLYAEGLNRGVGNITASRSCAQAEADGRAIAAKEDAACYHPLKGVCAALMIFAVPLVLAVIVALNAKEYTYAMQSVPTWLTSTYASREDVMAPLAAYAQQGGMAIIDWLRLIVRLLILAMVNFFEDPQKMTATIDRLSPLMVSVLPIAYIVGYLLAPKRAAKIEKANRRAKKVAVRRAERRKVGPELLGSQNQVHYGHRKDEKARKKKELI